MKKPIWFFFISTAALAGMLVSLIATAQTSVSSAGDKVDPKTGLPLVESEQIAEPTNNFVELSTSTGELRAINLNGIIVETNFTYLPCIKFSELSYADLFSLLDTKTGYNALAKFGNQKMRTSESKVFEKQLAEIWHSYDSLDMATALCKKIQTRLIILDYMRRYNEAAGDYARLTREGSDANFLREWHTIGLHDNALNHSAVIKTQMILDQRACAIYAVRLANYGINVSNSPPFVCIPPLSLKREIDSERAAN
jgi:hypothetical protein